MPRLSHVLLAVAATFLLGACSDSGNNNASISTESPRPALEFTSTESPIDLQGINADFAANIEYGEFKRNKFDIFLPRDCDEPTPLIMFIHGGGFTGGDKASYDAEQIRDALQQCIAWATINYRLLTVPGDADIVAAKDQGGVRTSLDDTALALQFMRYYSKSFNLAPEYVAAWGVSAGAGASLWLGTHDDLADPDNADPVLQESTRIKAAGAIATQATYDILAWEEVLIDLVEPLAGVLGGTDVPTLASNVGATNYLLTFLGAASLEELESEDRIAYRAELDMLTLMDADDAPIYTENYTTGFDNLMNMFLHHALHAIAVKKRADEVGLEAVGYSLDPAFPLTDPSEETLTQFLIRHLR
ncbi:MAG: carboxylesterase family protein [Halioglobus sp.]|nr:carboxylesterase family protein [Halioglobus sp.]